MSKIIIVDDDAIVRESLAQVLIAKNYDVLGSGKNKDEAVSLYLEHKPDLVLMDIRMAGGSGLDATREILSEDKSAKILLLTTFHDKEYIDEAIGLGCKGYILKENISSLSSSIEAVLSGKIVFDSKIMETVISERSQDNGKDENKLEKKLASLEDLSEKQKEVLKLVADGMNNKEIAERLFLSEGTVRNYISDMLSKLNLRDRTQLAVYYYKDLT